MYSISYVICLKSSIVNIFFNIPNYSKAATIILAIACHGKWLMFANRAVLSVSIFRASASPHHTSSLVLIGNHILKYS